LSVLVLVLGGAALWPSVAHARGRRVVPNLQEPWTAPNARRDPVTIIGVTVHMPTDDGMPLATRRQVAQWIARANQALRPHGLAVELHRTVSLSGFTEVVRRRDRRRLAALAEHDGTIHVFVAEVLDAQSLASRRRVRGLHWRYHGLNRELRQREFVMVTLSAPKTTFAHEVGHLLGLRHNTAEDNIMCSCRRGNDTRFTPEQGAVMMAGADRFLSRQQQALAREEGQRYRSLDRARRRR
jgi:Metallo-peptidase family M12